MHRLILFIETLPNKVLVKLLIRLFLQTMYSVIGLISIIIMASYHIMGVSNIWRARWREFPPCGQRTVGGDWAPFYRLRDCLMFWTSGLTDSTRLVSHDEHCVSVCVALPHLVSDRSWHQRWVLIRNQQNYHRKKIDKAEDKAMKSRLSVSRQLRDENGCGRAVISHYYYV